MSESRRPEEHERERRPPVPPEGAHGAVPPGLVRPNRTLQRIAVLGAFAMPIGALGTRLGAWDFPVGLGVFAAGALCTLLCGVIGLVAVVRNRRRPRLAGAGPEGPVFLAGLTLLLLWPYIIASVRSPRINQVSTDLNDPPPFSAILRMRGADANPLPISVETADAQETGYPWLTTQYVPLPMDTAYEVALIVLRDAMGLEIVSADEELGVIEAIETTFWFGFKDDVSVRIRPDRGGSIIDMRSASRVGRADLGANADRVAGFLIRFAEEGDVEPHPAR